MNQRQSRQRAARAVAIEQTRGVAAGLAASGLLVAALLLGLAAAGQAAAQDPRTPPASFAELAERLLPAVVNISTTQVVEGRGPGSGPELPQFPPGSPFEDFFKEFFDRHRDRDAPPRRATSLGSGFVIDADEGFIVTNNHVIQDADEITVILHDDTNLKADVVGRDPKTDIALLRIDTDRDLVEVTLGDSDGLRVGDWVLAIGNPFGLGGTVTAGIVSARARDINAGPYDDFLQTDASINRGNSGGPMFNLDGEVIGINTAIFSPSGGSVGIGFAVPANLAEPVIAQLREYGRTRRGWLGVRIQTVTDEIAESLGLDGARGALVASVTDQGPAALAGIEPGDVILVFDGQDVPEMRRLPRIVAETRIGKTVDVDVWRDGTEVTIPVTIGELEKAEETGLLSADRGPKTNSDAVRSFSKLGLELSMITPALRREHDLDDRVSGVVVTDVARDSSAAEKGIRPGDVIVEVNQQEVSNPEDVATRIEDARSHNKPSVLLFINRQGDLRFVALSLEEK